MSPAVPHFGAHDLYGPRSKTSTRNRRHPRADRARPTKQGPRANSMKRALIARHRDTSPTRAPRNWRKGHRTSCRDDGYIVSLRRRKPPYPCEVRAARCRGTTRKSNAVRRHAPPLRLPSGGASRGEHKAVGYPAYPDSGRQEGRARSCPPRFTVGEREAIVLCGLLQAEERRKLGGAGAGRGGLRLPPPSRRRVPSRSP